MTDHVFDQRGVRRVNLSVPLADESVIQWLDVQENKSISFRAIVRDYIERHGYTDPMCLPVAQGPRRGRPPVLSVRDEDFDDSQVKPVETRRTPSRPIPEPSPEPVEPHVSEPFVMTPPDEVFEDESAHDEGSSDDSQGDDIQLDENGMPILDGMFGM